jgi:hypothetical protein
MTFLDGHYLSCVFCYSPAFCLNNKIHFFFYTSLTLRRGLPKLLINIFDFLMLYAKSYPQRWLCNLLSP